jgi:hypothetical protein
VHHHDAEAGVSIPISKKNQRFPKKEDITDRITSAKTGVIPQKIAKYACQRQSEDSNANCYASSESARQS